MINSEKQKKKKKLPAFSVIKVISIFFLRECFFVYVLNDLLFANQNDPKAG